MARSNVEKLSASPQSEKLDELAGEGSCGSSSTKGAACQKTAASTPRSRATRGAVRRRHGTPGPGASPPALTPGSGGTGAGICVKLSVKLVALGWLRFASDACSWRRAIVRYPAADRGWSHFFLGCWRKGSPRLRLLV